MLFETGKVVNQSQLADLFGVKTLRNTRFIKERNALVIITDYTRGMHLDKWIGDTLHYSSGSKITGATNSKLADSRTNGIQMYLFQVMTPGEYTYSGSAKLVADPYTETQPDGTLNWVFPIKSDLGDQVERPHALIFADMEDYKTRGDETIRHFIRRRDNYIGYRVRHTAHGLGTVGDFNGSVLTVNFDNRQTKTYNFQKSFQGGYLQFLD